MSEPAWPTGYAPAEAALHVANSTACSAPAEAVWAWLVRPDRWHRFYGNARRIHPVDGPWPELGLGSRFRWVTFGAPAISTVTEFQPPHRLAWSGGTLGVRAYHVWLLTPAGTGCHITTEETQRGPAARMLAPALRLMLSRQHQRWVEGAARIAVSTSAVPGS
jgi:hypothetical protein